MAPSDTDPPASPPPGPLETTASLIERVRSGDATARQVLLSRYLPALRRFAHGRLPRGARRLLDTDDLVQSTMLRALEHVDRFEARREGAFLAYLRQILVNLVRDAAREDARWGNLELPTDELPDPRAGSILDEAIGREEAEIYERALGRLPARDREVVVLRVELSWPHARVAEATGCASANTARMVASRAVLRLAEEMRRLRRTGLAPERGGDTDPVR